MGRGKSILEPYKAEIIEMLDSGCTYKYITDVLNQKYNLWTTKENMVYYCGSRNLRSKVTSGCHDDRIFIPRCDSCEHCLWVKAPVQNTNLRVCLSVNAMMDSKVKTSPMWCPKREIRSEI